MSVASSVPVGPRKRSSVGMTSPICSTPFAYMLRSMRSVACVSVSLTEEPEFFDCDQGFAEVFELDFHEPLWGDTDFSCLERSMFAAPLAGTRDLSSRTHDLGSRTHDLGSRTHDLGSRTHDLSSRTHDLDSRTHDLGSRTHDLGSRTHDLGSRTLDLSSRTHDLGSIRLSDLSRSQGTLQHILCRSQSMPSTGLKAIRRSVPRRFCVTECRTACMFCCFGVSLQCCVSGSSHYCDEIPRLEKRSSLVPGRELFGAAVWILEDLSGRCWMLACSVWGLLRRSCSRPRRRFLFSLSLP